MNNRNKKSIVLSANYNYVVQVETAIKSICNYNKDIEFCIFNKDFPQEWFININSKLKNFDSQINDIKISEDTSLYNIPENHITKEAFYRYFIPKYVKSEKVLYLDCDLVVTSNLDSLFEINIENYYCAAIRDMYDKNVFNSGVLLINNIKWREDFIMEKLVDFTEINSFKVSTVDQTALNTIFKDKWLELPKYYNYQTGALFVFQLYGEIASVYDSLPKEKRPAIIHYTTSNKPWLNNIAVYYRDLWWKYHNKEWLEIFLSSKKHDKKKKKLFILTNSADMPHIEYLVNNLKEFEINIAAYTLFAPVILELQKYFNVRIHPQILKPEVDRLLKESSAYLDINYYDEVDNIVSRFLELGKPVYSFRETNHDNSNRSSIFELSEVDIMISKIRESLL